MRRIAALFVCAALLGSSFVGTAAYAAQKESLVEFERMTWPEVKAALAAGKTTAIFYTGGVEQRGPQNANGGHNLMARATGIAIARKLGNAIAMPVVPFTPNNASAELPGTIGITNDILAVLMERLTEQTIQTGFKNVVLMGDHGGGQGVYRDVAAKLDAKYKPQGIRVFYGDETYAKANGDFEKWAEANGHPPSAHGGMPDTAEMLYLDTENEWVRRDLIATAVGDPVLPEGTKPSPSAKLVNNGITGDARGSTPELGKRALDMKVDYAVRQIQTFIPPASK